MVMHLISPVFIVDKKRLAETYITAPKCINRRQVSRVRTHELFFYVLLSALEIHTVGSCAPGV